MFRLYWSVAQNATANPAGNRGICGREERSADASSLEGPARRIVAEPPSRQGGDDHLSSSSSFSFFSAFLPWSILVVKVSTRASIEKWKVDLPLLDGRP